MPKQLTLDDIPLNRRFMMLHDRGTESPVVGNIIYCFDDNENEVGYYVPALDLSNSKKLNTSTAGRPWSDEFKQSLIPASAWRRYK